MSVESLPPEQALWLQKKYAVPVMVTYHSEAAKADITFSAIPAELCNIIKGIYPAKQVKRIWITDASIARIKQMRDAPAVASPTEGRDLGATHERST